MYFQNECIQNNIEIEQFVLLKKLMIQIDNFHIENDPSCDEIAGNKDCH